MNLVDRYYTLILKEQVRQLRLYERKKERADKTIQELALTPAHITQRYWQAVSQSELCIDEINKIKDEMNYLNKIYHWKDMLHQDRFSFITDEVLRLVR